MAKLDFFPQLFYIMSPKNEIAPFSLCPTWFLKIVPPSGHYPQQKNSPAFLFTQKNVKMRHSTRQYSKGTYTKQCTLQEPRKPRSYLEPTIYRFTDTGAASVFLKEKNQKNCFWEKNKLWSRGFWYIVCYFLLSFGTLHSKNT